MKKIFFFISLILTINVFANNIDTVTVPIQRQYFHDKIKDEQKLLDKADGKFDGIIRVSSHDEVNLAVTDIMTRKIKELQDFVELNSKIPSNNEKIRYLNYIENLVRAFRNGWKSKQLNPAYAPMLVSDFEKVMIANMDSISMAPYIEEAPYEIGKIIATTFTDNKGYTESKNILFLKFCTTNPDKILQNIDPFVNEPFADSLVVLACKNNPAQLYNNAQDIASKVGKLIHRNNNPMVKAVVQISKMNSPLRYFPFLDDILSGKKNVDSLRKIIGDGDDNYDYVNYYKLLVQTEIDYSRRLVNKDTAVAMFGPNGLRNMLETKAIQHFITPINELHEQPENVRMKAIEPLSSIDLYYMIVMGESDIYTSSYKHSFTRLIQRLGKKPHTDSLLMTINFDYFKKFIKMAANFNRLDTFLALMPAEKSEALMKAFVSNLNKTPNLEDAVDVADAYSSINNKGLLKSILQYVVDNEQKSINNNNDRGKIIYGLLKTIFLSADSTNKIDLTSTVGIPSIYSIENKDLADDSGRIVQEVFFYGDQDGKGIFNSFVNSFSPKDWRITMQKEWVEIKSLKGKKIWIYANRALDSDKNLDDSAQAHLNQYLEKNGLHPAIVVHRGHSYWLPGTISRMPGEAKVIVLGSCGGYKNLKQLLAINPDAHIISTKEIGKGDINKPILNYLNQNLLTGKPLSWRNMWGTLTKLFSSYDRDTKESWEAYVPPYKNLGAIFIKAYTKKTEAE